MEVYPTGERKPATVTHEDALSYATAAAKAFGVGESRTVEFDRERAKKDVQRRRREEDKAKKDKKAEAGEAS